MTEQEKSRAIMYGLALGDAMGYPIEFLKMDKITTIYGTSGIQDAPDPAIYSDETQTTLALAESLIEAGDQDIDSIMRVFTRHLITWNNSPDNTRHPGHTVSEAVRTMEAGVHWKESGANAKGNGAVIRVAPIGFFYQNDPDKLREVAVATGLATHNNEVSNAASIGAAYMIKLALDGVPPDQYVNLIREFTRDTSEEFDDWLLRIGHVAGWGDEFAATNHLGHGWVAHETVAVAIYCCLRYPDDFAKAVQLAVNTDGDSDSLGSVTGGLLGALNGLSVLPDGWIERIEDVKHLTDVADRLAAAKEKVYG